jgi:hypothetical protein
MSAAFHLEERDIPGESGENITKVLAPEEKTKTPTQHGSGQGNLERGKRAVVGLVHGESDAGTCGREQEVRVPRLTLAKGSIDLSLGFACHRSFLTRFAHAA